METVPRTQSCLLKAGALGQPNLGDEAGSAWLLDTHRNCVNTEDRAPFRNISKNGGKKFTSKDRF